MVARQRQPGRRLRSSRTRGGYHRKVTAHIKDNLETHPIVARRHYIQTGNLRHFDVAYCTLAELDKIAPEPAPSADGRILIPLCETQEEVHLATLLLAGSREDLRH